MHMFMYIYKSMYDLLFIEKILHCNYGKLYAMFNLEQYKET